MLDYLLKSGAILAILFLFYKLVLENAQMHTFKRGYLLFSLLAAFGIPLLVFTKIEYYIPQIMETFAMNESFSLEEPTIMVVKTNYLAIVLKTIYLMGVVLFGIKFLINLFSIGKRIKQNPHHKRPPFTEVLMANLKSPYTFFNYIFLDKYSAETNAIPKAVIWHEEAHAKQKHSLDVLLIEAIQVVFWFNPFLHFIKKSIKLNHEFLADKAVLNKGIPAQTYQQTILSFSTHENYPQFSNALNYKPIKKRFTQMKTKTTKKAIWIKSLLILPLLAVLIYSFSQKETKKVAQTVDTNTSEQQLDSDGATQKMMEEYLAFLKRSEIKWPNGHTKLIVMGDELERARAIYAIMNDQQRSVVKAISVKLPPIDLSKVSPRKMTASQFEKFKDGKTYAIWIDSKHVPNNTLNNYSYKDFKHYSGSIVHKNARSQNFPQPNQYHLYTAKGFEHTYLNAQENRLKKLTANYNKKIKDSEDESTKRIYQKMIEMQLDKVSNSNLKEATLEQIAIYNKWAKKYKGIEPGKVAIKHKEYVPMKAIYDMMSVKQKKSAEPFPILPPPPPQGEATPKQLATYNRLAKKYNAMLNTGDIYIKMVEVNQMKAIYAVMSMKQKKSAEPFPNIPPPPPPPPVPKVKGTNPPPPPPPNSAPPKRLAEYNELAKKYNDPQKLGYPHIKEKDFKKMEAIYAVMSMKQKKSAEPFPPPPPPPPFTPNPTDHMIKLAKKGAEFYFEGKKISSDRAIELTKKNKSINVEVKEINGKKPQVKLSDKPIEIGARDYPEIEEEIEEIVESPIAEEIEIVEEVEVKESPGVEELIEVTEVELEEIVEEEIEVVEEKVIEIPMQFPSTIKTNKTATRGVIRHNNKTLYFVKDKDGTSYFDRYGKSVQMDKNFKEKKGWIYMNNETFYFVVNGTEIKYFNRFGKEADANGVLLK